MLVSVPARFGLRLVASSLQLLHVEYCKLVRAAVACLLSISVEAQVRTLPACKTAGQHVRLSLNTGTKGGFPPPGIPDAIWTIVQPAGIMPFTTSPIYPTLPVWLPNTAVSKWIQPFPTGTPTQAPHGATYVYETHFATPVDPYFYTSISLSGRFMVDDGAVIKLNGVQIATCTVVSIGPNYCFNSWKAIPAGVSWSSFSRAGAFLNVVTVEVKNIADPNTPTGLRMEAQVEAVCSKCTAPVPIPTPPCAGDPSTC